MKLGGELLIPQLLISILVQAVFLRAALSWGAKTSLSFGLACVWGLGICGLTILSNSLALAAELHPAPLGILFTILLALGISKLIRDETTKNPLGVKKAFVVIGIHTALNLGILGMLYFIAKSAHAI
jgi:hypothetical protein